MIALLRGVLLEKHPNQAVVEAGGGGYDVTIPVSTYTHLPETGAEVRLRIHTHVREDALALYGFLTQDEKALFEKLIGVSGNRFADSGTIGPCADRLYAVEPAGVEISTPSHDNSASRTRPSIVMRIFAAWRCCRSKLTSLRN